MIEKNNGLRPVTRKEYPMIEKCEFGIIVIDGKNYTSDIILYPDGSAEDGWWRKSGHRLSKNDIDALIQSGPEVIVAGTGISGMMKPEPGLEKFLHEKGISFIAEPNRNAMKIYNDLSAVKKTGACFHLTC
jgi:hypothetical protein